MFCRQVTGARGLQSTCTRLLPSVREHKKRSRDDSSKRSRRQQ